jgi:hypothetical protein
MTIVIVVSASVLIVACSAYALRKRSGARD